MVSGATATIRLGCAVVGRRHAASPTPISAGRCIAAELANHDRIRMPRAPLRPPRRRTHLRGMRRGRGSTGGCAEEAADVALLFPQFPIQTTLLIRRGRRLVIGCAGAAAARHEQNSRKRCARGRDGNVADVMYFRSHSLYFKPLLFRISRLRRMCAPPAAAPYFSSARRPSKRGRINL